MSRDKGRDAGKLIRVAGSQEIKEEQLQRVRAGKRSVLLMRWQGVIVAVDATCPHAAADLGRGALHRWKLTCPEHNYCFDIRTGNIIWPEDENYRLKRYEVHEENGSVFIRLD